MFEDFSFSGFKSKFKEDKKFRLISIISGSVLVVLLGVFVYYQFVYLPNDEESKDIYFETLNYADSTNKTDKNIKTLEGKLAEYEGYTGALATEFILARQYMNKGQFDKAITSLENIEPEDTYMSVFKIGLLGDCYSEQGKLTEAFEQYTLAANTNTNEFTTPIFLFKAGLVAEKLNQFSEAANCYKKIKDNYKEFGQLKRIDYYVARASNTKVN
jgi:predicted negative regulator of RcsB-dependent stress response